MFPSRLPDLSSGTLIAIWSATVVLILLVFVRAAFVLCCFWRRGSHYPESWTSAQLRYLKVTALLVGVALMLTWVALLYAAPFLPWRYPFSQSNAVLYLGLLVQTYAWLVMVRPFDWNRSPLARMKFSYVFAGVVVWWTAVLGTTIYMIAALALPNAFPPSRLLPSKFALAAAPSSSQPILRRSNRSVVPSI